MVEKQKILRNAFIDLRKEDLFQQCKFKLRKKDNLKALNLYTAAKSAHFLWEEA